VTQAPTLDPGEPGPPIEKERANPSQVGGLESETVTQAPTLDPGEPGVEGPLKKTHQRRRERERSEIDLRGEAARSKRRFAVPSKTAKQNLQPRLI
jgi:hypothetical protein